MYLGSHPSARDLVVVGIPIGEILGALGKKFLDVSLLFEHQVEISLGRRGVVPARPLHPDIPEF